ncbi:hypothetical protein [Paraburkholderia antibiotica]|uniref:Lipoprotein n=1 Tax=Paraburkholderia antibiotica TaxID=2728839 RepID=A0A7X9X5U8_9BURK|nr:hypothetical protein [Paraburkholderia antibiotica]NML31467.1 hypothetical protein [Paraburkholderia antibiotica]
MRILKFSGAMIVSVAMAACAQPPSDQREFAHVQWLPAIKAIIQSGDLADHRSVATQLNLILVAKEPVPVTDLDGKITGESIDVETVPPAKSFDNGKIRFRYGVYIPNDHSYRRAILIVRNIGLSECITVPDIYETFGYVRQTTYAHSANRTAGYHFKAANTIDLYFTFADEHTKCAEEVAIFQNRWK